MRLILSILNLFFFYRGLISLDINYFEPIPGVLYSHDYVRIFRDIANGEIDEVSAFRQLILNDLWFIVFFVMGVPTANHPFVVTACREVETGPKDYTLDLWAREHFKSTIITKAETIQDILKNPEERIAIFSHTRAAAKGFLKPIKLMLETSTMLKVCFSDLLYNKPETESPSWSDDGGITIKRSGSYTEATVEAWGLIEGMPTGRHFTKRKYDDIMTDDYTKNPEVMEELADKFDLSRNLGTEGGTHRVVGTTYHYKDVYSKLRVALGTDGKLAYNTRVKPATDNGRFNGKPVFLSQKSLDNLKVNIKMFNSQQLLDPSPIGVRALESSYLKFVPPREVPRFLYKFMVIDPAGDNKSGRKNKKDSWAICVYGVDPHPTDIGASDIYLLDAIIDILREEQAPAEIARMYVRNGLILQIGVEKVALSTTEIHVANALATMGIHVSVENGSIFLLRPAGLSNAERIERIIPWPLYNGKIHISEDIDESYKQRIITECDQFPFFHDDFLTTLSYLYYLIKKFKFGWMDDEEEELIRAGGSNVSLIGSAPSLGRNPVTGY